VEIERLGAPLGAAVVGLDVTTVDDATWARLDELFVEHHVLVFPGQDLTPEDQLAFASRWGALMRHPYAGMEVHPELIELTNLGKARDRNQHWHSDMTYEVAPPKLTMLYARSVPRIGGDTAFANQELAFDDLSEGLRATLSGLCAVHTGDAVASAHGHDASGAPRAEHPVVRTHDQSGRRSLYVCRLFTERFVGWTRAESQPLLEYLFGHATRPEYQVRHRYRRATW
jgi:taurine dioxygenase